MHSRFVLTLSGIAAAAGLAVAARRWLLVVRVDGTSMEPTYHHGDRLLAVRVRRPERVKAGDAVVVLAPAPGWRAGQPLGDAEVTVVKRVHAVDGDRVAVRGDAEGSYDSTTFGPLPRTAVVARVRARL